MENPKYIQTLSHLRYLTLETPYAKYKKHSENEIEM